MLAIDFSFYNVTRSQNGCENFLFKSSKYNFKDCFTYNNSSLTISYFRCKLEKSLTISPNKFDLQP